jgi:DNA polymerase III delta prime subunit
MKKEKSILTEVLSLRISKDEKNMLRDLQNKYYFDIFQFIRDTIKLEYSKRTNENAK